MENEYPKAIYRPGDEGVWDGVSMDFGTVVDAEDEAAALDKGWFLSPADFPGDEDEPAAEPSLLDKNAREIELALPDLSIDELEALKAAETAGKSRKGVLADIEAALEAKLAD